MLKTKLVDGLVRSKNLSPRSLKSIKVHYSGNLVRLGTAGMKIHGSVFFVYRKTGGLTTWTWGGSICLRTTTMEFGYGQPNDRVGFGPNRKFGLIFGNIT